MRAKRVFIGMTLLWMLLGAGFTSAREILQCDECVVEADETIAGNLFAFCRTLTINGIIEGNLIGAAFSAEINGRVEGDVYLVAGNLDTHGSLGDDLHYAGPVLQIHPETVFTDRRAGLMSASLSTAIAEGVRIPGTVIDLGYQLVIQGSVGDEVSFWGAALTIDGQVMGNVDATVGDPSGDVTQLQSLLRPFSEVVLVNPGLRLSERGAIEGQLSYTGPAEGEIVGTVASEPVFTQVVVLPEIIQEDTPRGLSIFVSEVIREFLTLVIVGGLGLLFTPRSLQSPLRVLQTRPLPSVSLGLLTFILSFPFWFVLITLSLLIVLILLLLQLSGLVILGGMTLGMMNAVGASLFYFVAIYVSRVIVALALGRGLVRMAVGDSANPRIVFLNLVVGVSVLAFLTSLPIIGWIVSAAAAFLGLGAILVNLQSQFRAVRENIPPGGDMSWLPRQEAIAKFPPPIISDSNRPLGMDNLPDGFTWWRDDD